MMDLQTYHVIKMNTLIVADGSRTLDSLEDAHNFGFWIARDQSVPLVTNLSCYLARRIDGFGIDAFKDLLASSASIVVVEEVADSLRRDVLTVFCEVGVCRRQPDGDALLVYWYDPRADGFDWSDLDDRLRAAECTIYPGWTGDPYAAVDAGQKPDDV